MNYQIGIVGAGIIAVYSALVLLIIVWPLGKFLKRFSWRWRLIGPIAFILLAAPWAEEYWIARNFELACKDAGVHVYKQVEVEGFYDSTTSTPHGEVFPMHAQELEESGFSFMELVSSEDKNKIVHIKKKDGQWRKEVLDQPTARYHYKYAYQPTPYKQEERIGWKLEKLGMVIVDSETGEVIGRDTQYRRTINIAEGSWRLYWGLAKTTCQGSAPKPPDLRHLLYHYVLIPAKH